MKFAPNHEVTRDIFTNRRNSQIKIKTKIVKLNLIDYCDTYTLFIGSIIDVGQGATKMINK